MKVVLKKLIAASILGLRHMPGLQAIAIAGICRIVPPPYRRADMEATIGPFRGASSASCVDGRQIGENNVYPPYLSKVRHPTKEINLGDSRAGHPVNISALQLLLKFWVDAMVIVGDARSRQIRLLNLKDGPLGHMDLLILGEICTSIPAYLLRRHESPIDSESIPLDIGAAYKLIAGLMKIIDKLIVEGDERLVSGQVPDAKDLYTYADEMNLLVARDGEACGGSRKMIIKLLDIAIHGLDATDYPIDAVNPVVREDQVFARYGIECSTIRMAYMLFRGELEQLALELRHYSEERYQADNPVDLLNEVLAFLPSPDRLERIGPAAFERSRTALNESIRAIAGKDLLDQLAGAARNTKYVSPMVEHLLDDVDVHDRQQIVAILNRYAAVLSIANEFITAQQQAVNRLLGVQQSPALDVAGIASQIFDMPQPAAMEICGRRLRLRANGEAHARLVPC